MKYILCYGDSNTWGCIPEHKGRYDFDKRWTGVMQKELGPSYHIYENALNGRTTVFEDPIEERRNGRDNFETLLEIHSPLDLIILMLGTNDCKDRHNQTPWDIAWGVDLLVTLIEKSACGREGKTPQILIAAPIHLNNRWGETLHGTIFSDKAIEKSTQLSAPYQKVAQLHSCHFFDASTIAEAQGDGIHMYEEDLKKLGLAFAKEVKSILA
jgi:lysophospholipase L1-like esterase